MVVRISQFYHSGGPSRELRQFKPTEKSQMELALHCKATGGYAAAIFSIFLTCLWVLAFSCWVFWGGERLDIHQAPAASEGLGPSPAPLSLPCVC